MLIIGYRKVVFSLKKTCKNWVNILFCKIFSLKLQNIVLRDGARLYLNSIIPPASLSMFCEIFADEVYNPAGFDIKHGDVVFDVGANAGYFSVYASRVKGTKVYAFEPIKRLADTILHSKELNNFENLSVHNIALSDKNGHVRFYVSQVHDGCHSLFLRSDTDEYIEVETKTLQTFCDETAVTKIDFLKLDCEGAEYEILLTMDKDFLQTRIVKLSMESHDDIVPGKTHEDIERFLKDNNFEVIVSQGFLYAKNLRN